VFLIHTDARVRDGEGLVGFVEFEVDAWRVDAIADDGLVLGVDEAEVSTLSSASEELEMISRRKISGCE